MKNKDFVQSYHLTVARYESNIYVKRILTHIVNGTQHYIKGERLDGVIDIKKDLFKNQEYSIDVKNVLFEDDRNYKRVYDAFKALQERFVNIDNEDISAYVPFITASYFEKGTGIVKFCISDLVYKLICDFSKGHRKLELNVCLSLSSVYAVRLYELMSKQKQQLTRTIDSLKKMFCLENKYKRVNDFIRYVIEPAKKELDSKSPYSFNYKINKRGKSYYSITFYPIYQPNYRDSDLLKKELERKISVGAFLTREIKDYLRNAFEFENLELRQNMELLNNASSLFGDEFLSFLIKIKPRALRAKNPKGYVINAIKKEIENRIKEFK